MKNNIAYILLSALILIALPACGGSKNNKITKTKTEHEVTINNEIDSLSIQLISDEMQSSDDAELTISKF